MPATDFCKQWTDAKKAFESATKRKKPSEETIKFFGTTFRKSSNVEKNLKAFDTAMKKGNPQDAAVAFQKAWQFCGAYANFLGKEFSKLPHDDPTAGEYQKLVMVLSQIVAQMPSKLEELQEEKGRVKVKVWGFLADLNGQLKTFDKAVKSDKPAAAAEKSHKVAKRAEPMQKALATYTKAAGASKVPEAHAALVAFEQAAKAFEKYCGNVLSAVKKDDTLAGYHKAVKELNDLVTTIRSNRGATAQASLKKLLDEM